MIHENWKTINLHDSFHLKARIGWQGLNTSEYLRTGEFGLVTGTDFQDGYIQWEKCVFVKQSRYDQDKNIQLQINDILITKDGTIGKVAFIDKLPQKTTLNSGVFVLRPKINIENKFCYFILLSTYFKNFLQKITAGSTITHLYQKDFITFDFPLPPLPEQIAIATALSDMDALIAQTSALIEKKKAIKQGVMQELLRPKEGWVKKKLGEVCELKKGQLITESTRINGEIPVIAGGKSPAYFHNKANRQGKTISISASGASAGYISFHSTPIFASDCSTISAESNFCIEFVFYWLQMNQSNIYKLQTGGAQPHIHPSDLNPLEISLPNINEQNLIAETLSIIDDELNFTQKKLQKLQLQKQGMMQALLTGKIRLV